MNPKVLIHTSCKILGLYLLVLAAMYLRDVIYWILLATTEAALGNHNPLVSLLPVYMLLTNAGAGLFLIFKADVVVDRIAPSDADNLSIHAGRTDLIELAIVGISIVSILSSLPEIIIKLVDYAYLNPHDHEDGTKSSYWNDANISNVIFSVFKFVAGLFLLLNARYLGRVLAQIGQKEDARPL